ncbi:MAG: peroxidase-related enzyme [Bacteroidetes bacterium]|nr:peroxidase-related enzyme [Bacteroidota bacterium]
MSWIKTIPYEDADKDLKRVYNKVKGPNNNIDNVLLIHSLRPHSLIGHMALYKNVLHNSNNKLPKWYLESIGVYVSYLNRCNYCVEHHFSGLKRLLNDDDKANNFLEAIKKDALEDNFDSKLYQGMLYSKKLTLELHSIKKDDITKLKTLGFSEGEILEINQVTSYFNYVNRTVIGLGVTTEGDILGLSPNNSNDPDNWSHQ